jgi:hypothetical protein
MTISCWIARIAQSPKQCSQAARYNGFAADQNLQTVAQHDRLVPDAAGLAALVFIDRGQLQTLGELLQKLDAHVAAGLGDQTAEQERARVPPPGDVARCVIVATNSSHFRMCSRCSRSPARNSWIDR